MGFYLTGTACTIPRTPLASTALGVPSADVPGQMVIASPTLQVRVFCCASGSSTRYDPSLVAISEPLPMLMTREPLLARAAC